MKIILTLVLTLMATGLATCGILLWRRRKETGDYSRHIKAIFCWSSAFFTLISIMRTWHETTIADEPLLEPEHTFVPLLMQMSYFLYPLEVTHLTVSKNTVYTLLFVPLLALVIIGRSAGIEYTTIHTYADLWQHIGEFNVLFRLFTLIVMLFYCFALFLVPFDWHNSSANKKSILRYSTGFCVIWLLHFSIQVSQDHLLMLVQQIVWFAFFMSVTWHELCKRLRLPGDPAPITVILQLEAPQICEYANDRLWERITDLLDNKEKWRDPNLSLSSLSESLKSNRTYVEKAFKRNTGMTFIKYITKRRIDYVTSERPKNPKTDIYELFKYVGYRQRSTAWRNFQKVTGLTPTEFFERLKASPSN